MFYIDKFAHSVRFIELTIFLLYAMPSFAQLDVLWERQVGGDNVDYMGDIASLNSDEFLISYSLNQIPFLRGFNKYSTNGMLIGSMSVPDSAYNVPITIVPQGRVALRMESPQDSTSFGLYSNQGEYLWRSDYALGYLNSIHVYALGGYVTPCLYSLGDHFNSVVNLYDVNGMLLWTRWDQTVESLWAGPVQSTADGVIYSPVSGGQSWKFRKLSANGELLAEIVYNVRGSVENTHLLPDGALLLDGFFEFNPDVYTKSVLLSPDGEILYNFIPPEIENSEVINVYPVSDGGYISSRYVPEYNLPFYGYMLFTKYDASWNQVWEYEYTEPFFSAYNVDHKLLILDDGSMIMLAEFYDFVDADVFLTRFQPIPFGLEIAAEPLSQTNAVPAPGRFLWHGTLTNNTDADITTDVWVIVRGPDGYPSEPLRVWQDVTVPANGVYEADLRQNIPGDAATGEYNYIVRCGEYIEGDPENSQHTIQAYFPLTVVSGWIPATVVAGRTVDSRPTVSQAEERRPGGVPVDLNPPRTHGVVPAPFDGPDRVQRPK